MQTTVVTFLVAAAALSQAASRNPIPQKELDYQQQTFERWWGQPLTLKLADLPTDGGVPDYRIPYSGHDYPDRAGGTVAALMRYDQAFHNGRQLATSFERIDVRNGDPDRRGLQPSNGGRFGLFARIREARMARTTNTRSWYGHCNGWTAAAIRHAEPQYSVRRNGVTFTPADIKGLLAEIYMYTDTEFLGGEDAVIHPALLHLTLTNWVGRGSQPIGVETAVGEVVINYPIYAYKSSVTERSDREVEVKMTVTYAMNTTREAHKSPRIGRQMFFHYLLDLDESGSITGGRYFTDSSRVDMLWTALQPVQGGRPGNAHGNPHIDVKEVLAIWRESVPAELRNKWLNIDPTEEDRILSDDELAALSSSDSEAAAARNTGTATPTESENTGVASAVEEPAAP